MCVIVLKQAGKKLPPDDTLKTCWDSNPDGAGFMYAKDGKVHIRKGFMKLKKLLEALHELPADCMSGNVVIHFRVGTHGAVSRECTHPFPVCDDYELMRATESTCDFGMAHNGVISFAASQDGIKSDGRISDSMWFAHNVASKYMELLELDKDFHISPLMNAAIGTNRFAFLRGDGYCWIVGDWYTVGDDEPVWYSNSSYEKPRYTARQTPTKYYGFGVHQSDFYEPPHLDDKPQKNDKPVKMAPETIIVKLTPDEHKIMIEKSKAIDCASCLFQMQTIEPCRKCLDAHPPYQLYIRAGTKGQHMKGHSLCGMCANIEKQPTTDPCLSCVANRQDNGMSTGFVQRADVQIGGEV